MKNELLDEFVEKVRAESDIVAVVSGYVPLKRRGNRYWGCCPFHHEKTPSFSVVPEQGFFYCFGCHAGGNVFKFISLAENVSYFEAIKLQAERLNIPLPQREKTPQEIAREQRINDLRKVQQMAGNFFHNCLTLTKYGVTAKKYFASRGISEETINEFQLGYAPDAWDKLASAFLKRGVKQELLLESGLVAERKNSQGVYDRFRNRVMIPIADERDRIAGFGGRVLDDSQPKYLNSPETILFNKRRLLFGLNKSHRAIAQAGFAIVVEGYMDAISLYSAGVHNVVASLGTAFTAEQCKKLLRYAQNIYFCYDSDAAGQNATMRAWEVVHHTGAKVKVIRIPEGKDPDEFVRRHGAQAFRKLIDEALPLLEFRLQYILENNDSSGLEGKVKALTALLPILAGVDNAVELDAYVTRVAQTLGIDEGAVRSELGKYDRSHGQGLRTAAAPVRKAAYRVESAVKSAGRIAVRAVWEDNSVLQHLLSVVPLEHFPSGQHLEILRFVDETIAAGEKPDDVLAAQKLSEEAMEELSRALTEDYDGQNFTLLYTECLRTLRKAYLKKLYEQHRLLADELERRDDPGFLRELEESQRIKKEMDDV